MRTNLRPLAATPSLVALIFAGMAGLSCTAAVPGVPDGDEGAGSDAPTAPTTQGEPGPGRSPADEGRVVGLSGGACLLDADCTSAEACVLGRCTKGCESDDACDEGTVCDPHGRCVAEVTKAAVEPLRTGPGLELGATRLEIPATRGEVSISVTNPTDAPLRYRLESFHALEMDAEPVSVGPGETAVSTIVVGPDDLEGRDEAIVRVISDRGTQEVVLAAVRGMTSGHYVGTVTLGRSTVLGSSSLAVNLVLNDDQTITGQTFLAGSFFWSRDVPVMGRWTPEGDVRIEIVDRIDPVDEPDDALRSPISVPVVREVVLTGRMTEEDGVLEGRSTTFIHGVADRPPVIVGTWTLRRTGALELASGKVVPRPVPPVLEDANEMLAFDATSCDGGLAAVAPFADTNLASKCAPCMPASPAGDDDTGPAFSCTAIEARTCGVALLAGAQKVSDVWSVGNVTVAEAKVQTQTPDGWAECSDGSPGHPFPCLDEAAITCAGALVRYAFAESPGFVTGRAVLDQLGQEVALATLTGMSHMVDAGLATLESPTGDSLGLEQAALDEALERYRRAISVALSPIALGSMGAVGDAWIRDRQGKDIVGVLSIETDFVDAFVTNLRLRARAKPGEKLQLRERTREAAAWIMVHGVLVTDLLETFEVDDPVGRVSVFGEALAGLRQLEGELQPGTNPFGYDPDYVPLALDQPQALAGRSNFEAVFEKTALDAERLKEREQGAAQARDAYEQKKFSSESDLATVTDQFNGAIIEICGPSREDPSLPDISGCGTKGGALLAARQRLTEATLAITRSLLEQEANHQEIEIEEQRLAEILANDAELSKFIDVKTQDIEFERQMGESERSLKRQSAARAECTRVQRARWLEHAANAVEAAREIAAAPTLKTALAVTAVTAELGAKAAQVELRTKQACDRAKDEAGLTNALAESERKQEAKVLIINQEIDREVRASQSREKAIESAARVAAIANRDDVLEQAVEQASAAAETSHMEILNLYAQAGSLLARRERARARLFRDPSNPYLNPSFLVVRNELGKGLSAVRETTLRSTYRAARALEYAMNRDMPAIEARLFPARSAAQVLDFRACLLRSHDRYTEAFGSPQEQVIEISLREDVFGITEPRTDPVTGQEISPADQFRAILADPDRVRDDGSIVLELPLALGDRSLFATFGCDARVTTFQAKLVGDYLGDDHAEVLVGYDGSSQMRRCDAEDVASTEALVHYHLGQRRVVVQTGVNDFGLSGPNAGFAAWPVGGTGWSVTIPSGEATPANADFDPGQISDVIVRIAYRAGTVRESGEGVFDVSCS